MKTVIFDIDGTLANIEHRTHYVRNGNHDWDKFYSEIEFDAPRPEVIRLTQWYWDNGYHVILCSGRPEHTREATVTWLHDNHVVYEELHMRLDNDYRADYIVKKEMLDYIVGQGFDIEVVYDDREQVVDMWRDNNIPVFQVAPGDFDERTRYKPGKLLLMVGPSGAGKSTWIDEAIIANEYVVLSTDHFRQVISGDFRSQENNTQVFDAVHATIKTLIRKGVNVCVDATNLRNKDRKKINSLVPDNTKITYYVIDRPLNQKIATADWRKEVMVRGVSLIEYHDNLFRSNLKDILRGDNDLRVTVIDMRDCGED